MTATGKALIEAQVAILTRKSGDIAGQIDRLTTTQQQGVDTLAQLTQERATVQAQIADLQRDYAL